MIKLLFRLALPVFFYISLTAIVASAENKKSVVKVGVFQLDPLVYIDDKGSPQGVFVDMI